MLCVAYLGLGVLAAISVGLAALPPALAAPLALLLVARGGWLARGEWRRAPCAVLFAGVEPPLMIDQHGVRHAIAAPALSLRGGFASLCWRDEAGARHSLLWFADTLPVASRRMLRLQFGAARRALR
jgi:hypothetical protein